MLEVKTVITAVSFHSQVNWLFLTGEFFLYAWTDICFRLSFLAHMFSQTNLVAACSISLPLVVHLFKVPTVPEAQAPAVWCDQAGRIFLQAHWGVWQCCMVGGASGGRKGAASGFLHIGRWNSWAFTLIDWWPWVDIEDSNYRAKKSYSWEKNKEEFSPKIYIIIIKIKWKKGFLWFQQFCKCTTIPAVFEVKKKNYNPSFKVNI